MFWLVGIFCTIYGLATPDLTYAVTGALLLIAGVLAERS